jgi:transcriptional regulator with XRE-family HTH domain
MQNRIREIRKQKDITQVELAKKLGITQGGIQKLERGERCLTVEWMRKIADALDCKAYELLPLDMQPDITPEETEIIKTIRKLINKK